MAKFVLQPELPVSEQAQIRREKLAALQALSRLLKLCLLRVWYNEFHKLCA